MSATITGTLVPTIGLDPYAGKIAIRGSNPRAGFDLGYDAGVSDGALSGREAGYALGTAIGIDAGMVLGRGQGASDGFAIARGAGVASVTPAAIPEITIVATSPTPATDPGDAGGFPASASAAADTPIVLEVTGASLVLVTARRGAGDEEIVYRDDGFRGAFVARSVQAGALTLTILPDEGWLADVVIAVDAFGPDGGASAHEEFGWFLPRQPEAVAVEPVAAGSTDYLADALALLPWQLGQLVGS